MPVLHGKANTGARGLGFSMPDQEQVGGAFGRGKTGLAVFTGHQLAVLKRTALELTGKPGQ